MRIFSQGWSNGFDGPGRRLVFYLKGCNFKCLWCGNPESISNQKEVLFYPEKSKFAKESCPYGAVAESVLNRDKCRKCTDMACINKWHDPAFELSGEDIDVARLANEVMKRRDLFSGGGGVTFSGGEPTLQMEELLEVAGQLKQQGINLAIETNASSPRYAELEGSFDYIFSDLKCVTPELHKRMTGIDNAQVLNNLCLPIKKVIRIPLINELNFTQEEQEKMADFLAHACFERVELLRLHQLGLPKYMALGIKYPAEQYNPPEKEEVEAYASELNQKGINCIIAN